MSVNLTPAPVTTIPQGRAATATSFYTLPGAGLGVGGGTLALAANTLYHYPIYVATQIIIDQLAIEVTTAVAATNVRMGIYTANTSWQPVTLQVDAGTVATATTGVKTIATTQTLVAGRYLLVLVSDGAPTLRYQLYSVASVGALLDTLGATPQQNRWNRAFTYAALPAAANWDTAPTGDNAHALISQMYVRVLTP